MPQIYDRPVHQLMRELIRQRLPGPGSVLTRLEAIAWFADHYPKIRPGTVAAHLLRFATNEPVRLHYHHQPGEEDLLFKIQPGRYRLYDRASDPAPITASTMTTPTAGPAAGAFSPTEEPDDEEPVAGSGEFAYEGDLRNYLAKNLPLLEAGLRLYEDDGITGIEFPVGGRRIDVLAVSDRNE